MKTSGFENNVLKVANSLVVLKSFIFFFCELEKSVLNEKCELEIGELHTMMKIATCSECFSYSLM